MVESGLGKKVLKSLTWVGSANAISQVLSWAITIVIVRHLSPGDFGLMAMAVAFWGFLTMIGDFGLFASIVQSKEVSKEQLQEIFGFIIVLNILFLIMTYYAAPIISSYFSEPRLMSILRMLCIVFIFIPFYVIPHSLLLRAMNFKKISIIDVCCGLCGAFTSFLFALSGHGVWSLVYGTIVHFFSRAVSFTIVATSYYRLLFGIKQIKGMLSFSSFFTGSTILRYFFFKSDIIVGGKFIGPDALGLYSIANQLSFAPVEKMSYIIPQVAFPAFSKMQIDLKAYAANFLKGLKLLNLIFIPCYIVFFVLAEDIVKVLLGTKWFEIILPIRILCMIMPMRAFEILFIPAMNGLGKSNITMLTSGLSLIIMVCAFLVGLNWGYIGLCWAWVGGFTLVFTFMIGMCVENLRVSAAAIAETYKTPLIASIGLLIAGGLLLNNYRYIIQPLFRITVFLTASILLYCASVFLIDRPIVAYLKNILMLRKSG
jgi:teichuronic acid exporter